MWYSLAYILLGGRVLRLTNTNPNCNCAKAYKVPGLQRGVPPLRDRNHAHHDIPVGRHSKSCDQYMARL